jgi:hypothetical protein
MKFTLEAIKKDVGDSGVTESRSLIQGKEVHKDLITVADMEKVIEVEHYLERLFGVRFHINVIEEGK